MHAWDNTTPIDETMATLDGFVRAGKVRYIGCSNYTGSQILLVWCLPHRVVAPRQEPKIPRSYTRIFRLDGTLEGMELTLPDEALKALSDVSRPGDRR